jgi:hypothetical protein
MVRFPVDAPKRKVIRTFEKLGFYVVREREHIAMGARQCRRHKNAANFAESYDYQRFDFANNLQSIRNQPGRISERIRKKLNAAKRS